MIFGGRAEATAWQIGGCFASAFSARGRVRLG
jgi:hypothetical protein